MAAFGRHLALQYQDRIEYWKCRSNSRMRQPLPDGYLHISAFADGMDHGKFALPRHAIFDSKEFQGFQIGLFLTQLQLFVTATASRYIWAKDSSFSMEAILHTLDQLAAEGIDLRKVCLQLQADNTTREIKNNTILRGVGGLRWPLIGCTPQGCVT